MVYARVKNRAYLNLLYLKLRSNTPAAQIAKGTSKASSASEPVMNLHVSGSK